MRRIGVAHGLVLLAVAGACSGPAPVPVYAVHDRGADSDNDGAADVDDACRDEPEDGLPPRANDGCPAPDPDNDGIARETDRCPDSKEDGLPPNPTDGCPSNDADGDGVADAKDACPDGQEDNLPPNPNDGCPANDGDGDGIADSDDRCPSEPETVNGYRDDDGCPDASGDRVVYEDGRIYVPDGRKLDFDPDSADLRPDSAPTLDEIAAILAAHPEIERVEIEGHASTLGDANYNVDLTERRAIAVARGLTERGVAAARLVVIGYGEYCPRVPTADEVDEPRNRRVELVTAVVGGVWQDVPRGCWRAQARGINPTTRTPGYFQPIRSQPNQPTVRGAGGA